MKIWRLKKGADRRFRQGHPWVFASELAHSAKEVSAGEVVELRDSRESFLAFGYTHPAAQICFRRLSSRSKESDVLTEAFFVRRLRAARDARMRTGWDVASHRWLFAESDGVPGLVLDAFLRGRRDWVLVAQASTAGMEKALPQLWNAVQTFAAELGDLALIEAPNSKSRVREGLKVGAKTLIAGNASGLENTRIHLLHGLTLHCDLLNGQKTGFFLDQQANVGILRNYLATAFEGRLANNPVRILDICTYVGQWSAHTAHALEAQGLKSHVTLLDVSDAALRLAATNVQTLVEQVDLVHGDALSKVSELGEGLFDLVICDPPAFVKKRADLAQGLQAYVKLNREAMRACRPGGLLVASSCSGLVGANDWKDVLLHAGQKAGRTFREWQRGGHGPDHPVRADFPEGEYLKCSIGSVELPF